MGEFCVRIREVLEREVKVTAASMTDARDIVRNGYRNSEYVLDSGDFKEVSIAALYPRSMGYER